MLKNLNKKESELYVLHSDITEQNQEKLISVVNEFNNASITFINIESRFEKEWSTIKNKGHFSKECLYKLLLPDLFPSHDYIIMSDVDIVVLKDVSQAVQYCNDNQYIAGVKCLGRLSSYYNNQTMPTHYKEMLKSGIGAGFLVYNLKKMREDNIIAKFLEFMKNHYQIIIQPEQDIINIVCNGKIGYIPITYSMCTYMYNLYRSNNSGLSGVNGYYFNYWFKGYLHSLNDAHYKPSELKEAFTDPVIIHYATKWKPWNTFCSKQQFIWLRYLYKTPFFYDFWKSLLIKRWKIITLQKS